MPNFGNLVQKAFYLGVGIASVASEKAGSSLQELKNQGQKLADELVKRGEMTTEEAKKFVDDLVSQAQTTPPVEPSAESQPQQPRRIEILSEDEASTSGEMEDKDIERLRNQVKNLRDELDRLQQK